MEQTNLYTTTIPPMMKTLQNLSGILDKLSAHAAGKQLDWQPAGMQEENLLQSRLISDQFPFLKQVQVACDNGKGGAARLAGVEAPAFEDNETSVAQLKARVEKTLEFMKTIKPEQVIGQEARKVSLPYWKGKEMTAFGYSTEYLMPNFYFHVATAYSILRKNGVDLGKMDYIGSVPFVD
ncbi:MAG TPA: DUF1993 domain-containing protein [Candidatus Paceibacterota bacterium]|nr:DUF1993 domain-containing protein [Candidatus Paceibacterota bacterium]